MKLSRFANLLIMLALVVGILAAPAAAQSPSDPAFLDGNFDKVEALVREEIAAEGQTEFFVWMVEKADLSPADQLQTKQEKGRFVFNALVETAERTQKDLRAYLDAQGAKYKAFYIANKILVYNGGQALVMDLAARDDVARITANHPFQLQEPFDKQPAPEGITAVEANLTFINADDVWALGYDGAGTVMAGNDTGLDETHPAIARHYRGCLNPPTCTLWDHNYNWWDATGTYPTDPYDGNGHGTHTTGTMVGDDGGANQIGVAPGAQTVHCKNMTNSGSGSDATFTECFQWDLAPWDLSGANPNPDLAPDAINNSWGYRGGGDNVFRDEIQALHAAGVLVEVSAGNEGTSCGTLRSPGDYWEVLTTGSVQHLAPYPGTITGFSSRGPSSLDPGYYFPDIMAPGENIRSSFPNNQYGSISGTSMAGPHATALVGLMWSACPSFAGRVEDTIQIIRDTAVPLTGQGGSSCGGDYTDGPNHDWGHGTIDAQAAVQAVLDQCIGLGALNGTVTDNTLEAPIEGATITAEWDAGGQWSETTDASGYYSMTVPNGTYSVTAEHFGHLPATVYNVVVETDTVTTEDFSLTVATHHEVSGYVREDGTNAPLTAQIKVLGTPLAPIETNPANGYYSVSLPEDTYTFQVTAPQHGTELRDVAVDHDQTQNFYLPYQGQWELGPSVCFDFTRFDAAYFPTTEKIYVLGGRLDANTYGDIYEFDPVTGACSDTGANMPVAISNYTINLVNNGSADVLCTFGGRPQAGGTTDEVQCYDPIANTASIVNTLPAGYGTYLPGAQVVVNNNVYVFGGFDPLATPYMTAVTYVYDPVANSFTQLGNLGLARSYMFAQAVDGIIYAFGGDTFDGVNLNAVTNAEMLDPAVGTWDDAAVADLPLASGEGQTWGLDSDSTYGLASKLVLAGGGQWPGETADALVYDTASDTYDTSFPDLINARRNHAGTFVPLCTDDLNDGLPGLWVFGGRQAVDTPPYQPAEFLPLICGVAAPELSITKDVDVAQAYGGQLVTYTLFYTNSGDVDAMGALMTDTLPAEVSYVSSDPAGTYDPVNHEVLWTLDIISDTSDTIELVVEVRTTVPAGTMFHNHVTLRWENQAPAEAESPPVEVICPPDVPAADFSWEPTTIYTNTMVQFTDLSTGPVVEWAWDFGDDYTSSISDPVHTFFTTGTFTVTLWVTSDIGCSDMAAQMLTVEELPPPGPPLLYVYLPIVVKDK